MTTRSVSWLTSEDAAGIACARALLADGTELWVECTVGPAPLRWVVLDPAGPTPVAWGTATAVDQAQARAEQAVALLDLTR